MLMLRIILVLLISATALLARAQSSLAREFPYDPINGAICCLSVNEPGAPSTRLVDTWLQERFWQPVSFQVLQDSGDFSEETVLQRSGTGRFVVGVIANVMAVASPVQRFMNAYSFYDSGANPYSHPAVDIRPILRRGSAQVSFQLRL